MVAQKTVFLVTALEKTESALEPAVSRVSKNRGGLPHTPILSVRLARISQDRVAPPPRLSRIPDSNS